MKTTASLGNATRTAGKVFFALTLLLVAIAVGFGGTALFVYHQFGDIRHPDQPARGAVAERRPAAQPAPDQHTALRRVANGPADQAAYTFADNNGGQPTTPARRARPGDAAPAPLDPSQGSGNGAPAQLSDPESQYILDTKTGRVVGIDGSAGARREAEEDRLQQQSVPPQVVAVQTPPPEVRVASPVLADGLPVYHGEAVAPASTTGSQYLPIRKALPVTPDEATAPTFNAHEYMVDDQDRPVLRAQAVVPAGARVVKTVRVYRLQDGSQTVAAE